MADLAGAIKEEIRRLAKKEIKSETTATKQAVAQYRRDIASLKRKVHDQERKLAFLRAGSESGSKSLPPKRLLRASVSPPVRSRRSGTDLVSRRRTTRFWSAFRR